MAKPKRPSPFDVKMTATEREQFASDLCIDVQGALDARAAMIADGGLIDLYDWYYEQGRSAPKDRPFPGAADLTSYFITENVSALRARLMKAVFGVKPFCFVEGWGADAAKAPFVESFHDWQVRKSGLKLELYKTILGALIEDAYVLEVSEKIETRRITETIDAALDVSSGGPVFEGGQPKIALDEFGDPVPSKDGEASAKVQRTRTQTKRLGPQYDPISMKDFVFLPGHVKSEKLTWGHAYRIWARLPDLQEQVKDGIYDAEAVKTIGTQSDREMTDPPTNTSEIAPQYHDAREKELFQVSLKRDLDGDGREEWYVATISLLHRQVLRLKLDTFAMRVGKSRCVPFVLYPRRDSVYGYSYAGMLETLAEEHTSLRNMKADRQNLATNSPILRQRNSQWDPDTQPIGVGRVIDVGEMNELKQLQFTDVPSSVIQSEAFLHQSKERVGGLSDNFVGLLSSQDRTLGENRLAAGGSAVRVDEVVGHLHAAIATVMELSHAIWQDALAADPRGIAAPAGIADALKAQGMELQNGRFTEAQLKGEFAFEPYGSDATANPDRRKSDFNSGIEALANLAKVVPGLQVIFQNHEAAKAILEEWLRVYDVRDRQPFLGAFLAPPPPPTTGTGAPMGQPSAGGPPGAPPPGPPPPPSAAGPDGANPLQAIMALMATKGFTPGGTASVQ